MGIKQSKSKTTGQAVGDDRATRSGTAAAFRAIDTRNANKLRKALSMGATLGNVRRASSSGRSPNSTLSRPMSLLEYAVDKNFLSGVEIMLKVRLPSSWWPMIAANAIVFPICRYFIFDKLLWRTIMSNPYAVYSLIIIIV